MRYNNKRLVPNDLLPSTTIYQDRSKRIRPSIGHICC